MAVAVHINIPVHARQTPGQVPPPWSGLTRTTHNRPAIAGRYINMASVTSLDQDMKNLRMGRYTPQAANEVRAWIEETLGERLPAGDLLDALKDGTVLCR